MSRDSKFLSLILRHKPEQIGVKLDQNGWARIDDLLSKMKKAGRRISREQLFEIVDTNDKRRFTISDDGTRIRAAQGHSFDIDLGLDPSEPPSLLYHGTARHNLDSIFGKGIVPGGRHQVHLSPDYETAIKVGQRHGKPVVLTVNTEAMIKAGHQFYRADNGVWLTDEVPSEVLSFASEDVSAKPK